MTPHIGLKHVLNDELQVELKPHAWVTIKHKREPRISCLTLFPAFAEQYTLRHHDNLLLNRSYMR